MRYTAYLNRKFIPLKKARISVLDRGFLYGDGVFETMRGSRGRIEDIDKHVERLYVSLKALEIRVSLPKQKLKSIIYKLLKKNNLKNAYIKVLVTRGKSNGLLAPSGKSRPTVLAYALKYKPVPQEVYEKGIKVCVIQNGIFGKLKITGKKTINYLNNILCLAEARAGGYQDCILENSEGFVSEASSSNIFLVKNGRLFTPALNSGCLPGITRGKVLKFGRKFLKKPPKETLIAIKNLYAADEVFLTNSLAGIVPVCKIDGTPIGNGKPGGMTRALSKLLKKQKK